VRQNSCKSMKQSNLKIYSLQHSYILSRTYEPTTLAQIDLTKKNWSILSNTSFDISNKLLQQNTSFDISNKLLQQKVTLIGVVVFVVSLEQAEVLALEYSEQFQMT
jgi:hypothetical protein